MAVVEEDVAGDADAEGDLGGWTYGYLDSVIGLGRIGVVFVFGGYGYLDSFLSGLGLELADDFA